MSQKKFGADHGVRVVRATKLKWLKILSHNTGFKQPAPKFPSKEAKFLEISSFISLGTAANSADCCRFAPLCSLGLGLELELSNSN
jgi:hypothetical protein